MGRFVNKPNFMSDFHSISAKTCLKELKASENGLTLKEAESRLKKNGLNELAAKKDFSKIKLLLKQFQSPFIYILLLAGLASLLLRENGNAIVIFVAVALNTAIGFFQENKANDSLKKLRNMVRHQAVVLRQGRERKIDASQVVVGDIIILEAGSRLPADGRLLEAAELSINESILTGESYPARKTADKVPTGASLPDRHNMIYAGTVAVSGRGKAVVVATGRNTEVGKISDLVSTEEGLTPLQEKLDGLAKFLATLFLSVCTLVFILGIVEGRGIYEMFMVSVALAVSSIPEGLLISMTFILALGMQRLLKVSALTRKLVSAETLGSTTVICSDKTGTLTEGHMAVSHIIIGENEFEVSSPGSRQEGEEAKIVSLAMQISAMCNNAIIDNPDEPLAKWRFTGTPTERALLKAAYEAGIDSWELQKKELRVAERQFTSTTKFMATLHKTEKGLKLYEKGAPEVILEKSKTFYHHGEIVSLTDSHKDKILKNFEKLAATGFRLIAVGLKDIEGDLALEDKLDWDAIDNELTYVGLIALKDPLRPDAKETIRQARDAGIRPVIVTGDHKLIALAISKEIGLSVTKDGVVSGEDLDKMSDDELKKRCTKINIYARVSPHHKLRIINALRERGEVVAMTGDGINDAPALKAADVGIALGNGTDVAKESADIILLNNNFKVIVAAVEEGRKIYSTLRRVVTYLTSDAFCEIVLVTSSILLTSPLPILPVQILWLNIINDGFPNFALSFEKVTKTMMDRRPKKRDSALLTGEMKAIIFFVGMIVNVIIFIFFFYLFKAGVEIDHLRTLMFSILGAKSLLSIFSLRSLSRPIWQLNPFSNLYIWLAVGLSAGLLLLAIYLPPLQGLLGTASIGLKDWMTILGFSIFNLILLEATKLYYSNKEYSKK